MPEEKEIEVEETSVEEVQLPEVELNEEDIASIEASVLESNEGKTKEDLADEIAAAVETRKKEDGELLLKLDEIKGRDGNAEMSDEDALAIYEKESEEPVAEEEEAATIATATTASDDPFAIPNAVDESTAGSDSPEVQAQRLKELNDILNDQEVKQFVEFRKSGGSIGDYIASAGSIIDYNKLSPEEVLDLGLRDMVANSEMTQEQADSERELFNDEPSVIKKRDFVSGMRNALAKKQQDRVSQFISEPSNRAAQQQEMKRKVDADLDMLSNAKS